MADAVEVVPADGLRFRFAINKQLLATVSIHNPSDAKVAFKIKTTAPKKYVVRPSSGVVEPHSSVSVQVIMQAQKEVPPDLQNCKDKFMVQTTALAEGELLDKETFSKETRRDLREARLRVIMEGPAAPPSPVPEANEADDREQEARAATADGSAAQPSSDTQRVRGDASLVSAQLKATLDRVTRERDELRQKLDNIELQGGHSTKGSAPSSRADAVQQFRVSIVHIILVAIVAFLVGHYTMRRA
ncbi:PapD-like protein [Haematococcus lacustris]